MSYSPSQVAAILNRELSLDNMFTSKDIREGYACRPYQLSEQDVEYLKKEILEGYWPPRKTQRLILNEGIIVKAETSLKPRDEEIGQKYYTYPYPSYEKIGEEYKLTRERVRQIINGYRAKYGLEVLTPSMREELQKKHKFDPYMRMAESVVVFDKSLVDAIQDLHSSYLLFDEVFDELNRFIDVTEDVLMNIYQAYDMPIKTTKTHVHCTHCGKPIRRTV